MDVWKCKQKDNKKIKRKDLMKISRDAINSLYGLANQWRNLRKWDQSLYINCKINKAAVREMNC